MMTAEELRALFPEITDEEIASRTAAATAKADADKESQRQELQDQVNSHKAQIEALQAQIDALTVPAEG